MPSRVEHFIMRIDVSMDLITEIEFNIILCLPFAVLRSIVLSLARGFFVTVRVGTAYREMK